MRNIGMVALAVLAGMGTALVVLPDEALSEAVTCETSQPPDCGGAAGDQACGNPALDCVATDQGCQCQPRACCRCEAVAGTDSPACDVPCEDATLDTLQCAQTCFQAVESGASCALTVMVDKRCADGTCVPTGCCTVSITPDGQSPSIDICVATDAVTCATAPDTPGQFIPGGRCDGGLRGSCVPPPAGTATAA